MWNKTTKLNRDFKRKYKHKNDKFDTYTKYWDNFNKGEIKQWEETE